jgi:D-cysteine desulfhydrase family pyridoxal phosphate-dependent enzyme
MVRQLPRVPIAHLPTPVEELPRLSEFLRGPQLLVKRDDQTGLAFGGNKTRKLEYLLAEAQSRGCRTLVTAGAIQSNHCRQTAAAAARSGMGCVLVLSGEQPESPEANTYLDLLLGAELVWTTLEKRGETLNAVYSEAQDAGRKPYLVPYGGSSPLGAAAYAYAVRELVEQRVKPDWVVFPTSSGGTQAGLVAGAKLFGFEGKILGVSVDEPAGKLARTVANIASGIAELLQEEINIAEADVLINDDYLGTGYAQLGEPEREAIHLFARHEGLLVDPVYTGRAAAGLIDLVRTGFFKQGETVLFWHTGGTPALFAGQYRRALI